MLHRSRSRDHGSSTPGPTSFTKSQMNDFLADLRTNRPPRPCGSRPPPDSYRSPARQSMQTRDDSLSRSSMSSDSTKALGHSRSSSAMSYYHTTTSLTSGRSSPEKLHLNTLRDQAHRNIEKQQSHSVRVAMDALNTKSEDSVVIAAGIEASDLVWKHENPGAPYQVGDPLTRSRVDLPLDPSEIAEPVSIEVERRDQDSIICHHKPARKLSGAFSKNRLSSKRKSIGRLSSGNFRKLSIPNARENIWHDQANSSTTEAREYTQSKMSFSTHSRRNPFARAHTARQDSLASKNESPAYKPPDRFEIHRNPPSRSKDPFYKSNVPVHTDDGTTGPSIETSSDEREVRYKDGIEVRGDDIRAATSRSLRDRSPNLPSPIFVSDSPGRPIVSFDKGWKPSDREKDPSDNARTSQTRPTLEREETRDVPANPTRKAVSAPAVPTLKDMDEACRVNERQAGLLNGAPSIAVNAEPVIPEISICETPSVHIEDTTSATSTPVVITPSICEPDTPDNMTVTPTPKPRQPRFEIRSARPPPRHAVTAPTSSSNPQVTPHLMRADPTLCAQCALPIYGRTVAAAGTRFHPECFTCFHCSEALECVQFYPEPPVDREERLERIERRLVGDEVDPPDGCSMLDDNDDSLRFYCHLDYHEFFSPRCKNCKTPIEGEMIEALGAQYHPGHFFCANCGDVSTPGDHGRLKLIYFI